MLDHKTIMKAIQTLIERWLRRETISTTEFSAMEDQIEMYWDELAKKNPRVGPFDSSLAAWLIHEQLFLAGTQHESGGAPGYFWDLIQEECVNGEPVENRYCTELFRAF